MSLSVSVNPRWLLYQPACFYKYNAYIYSVCLTSIAYVWLFMLQIYKCVSGVDFTADGRYMALAERRECKDYISVFVCDDWHLLRVSAAIKASMFYSSFPPKFPALCLLSSSVKLAKYHWIRWRYMTWLSNTCIKCLVTTLVNMN